MIIKRNLKKAILLVLSCVILLNLVACSDGSSSKFLKTGAFKEFEEEIDKILSGLDMDLSDLEDKLPIAKEFKEADAEKRSIIALEMAKDMAIAEAFGLTTDEMFVLSGQAVKAYPHPLLLNNFAAMVHNRVGQEEALKLLLLALNQEENNPILLTNVANIYLELEDFSSAEEYVKRALQAQDDYGPAYQLMTTIHLNNENSILAAETMVKSAKHGFNDVTTYHFESFLSAVDRLDPLVDEYPLKEDFLDLLYTIAKENVDILNINDTIDTPEAQLQLKSFPQITSLDNLANSYDYLEEELGKIIDLKFASIQFGMDYIGAYNDYFYDTDEGGDGIYPVRKNLRQVYAYEVLKSFYEFKIEKIKARYLEDESKRYQDYRLNYDNIAKAYDEKIAGIRLEEEEIVKEWGKGSTSISNLEDALTYFMSDFIEDGSEAGQKLVQLYVKECEIEVSRYKDFLDIQELNSNALLASNHNQYNEIKQVLEEYWLKSSGLLKYISDEGLFYHYISEREAYVYNEVYDSLYPLTSEAMGLNMARGDLHSKEVILENAKATAAGMEAAMLEARRKENHNGGDISPHMERQELSVFPEDNVIGDLQISGSIYGIVGGSISYDGESLTIIGEHMGEEVGFKRNFRTGETTIHSLNGLQAIGATDWFKDSKTVQNALSNTGSLGKLTKVLGKMGLGYSNSERSGVFVTIDSKGNVSDRGTMYSKVRGGQVFDVGKSDEIVIERSFGTGLTTSSACTRYGFKYISISK